MILTYDGCDAVLEVYGLRGLTVLEAGCDACELFWVEQVSGVVECDEPGGGDLRRLEHDPVDVGRCQQPAVEQERDDLREVS